MESQICQEVLPISESANLRYPDAVFDDTIYDPERSLDTITIEGLSDCNWISEGRNLLISGNAGTGKSYLTCAFQISGELLAIPEVPLFANDPVYPFFKGKQIEVGIVHLSLKFFSHAGKLHIPQFEDKALNIAFFLHL